VLAVLAVAWGVRAWLEGRLFPPQRRRAIPWSDNEAFGWLMIGILILLVEFAEPSFVLDILRKTGFLPTPPPAQTEADGEPGSAKEVTGIDEASADEKKAAASLERTRTLLWVTVIAFPFQIATILGLVSLTSGLHPMHLGWTAHRWRQSLVLGYLGWLGLTAAANGMNYLVLLIYHLLQNVNVEQHALAKLLNRQPPASVSVLIVLTAMVTAPIREELLFRGLLQPWLSRRWYSGLIGIGIALAAAFLYRVDKMAPAWKASGLAGVAQELLAPVFVLAMIPGFFLARRLAVSFVRWRRRRQPAYGLGADRWPLRPQPVQELFAANAAGGIYGASLLFAAAHSNVWPSPVSLFMLALGLGYLRYRTQSLVAPIVVHGLFNGVPCLLLLLQPTLDPKEEKGKDTTSAVCLDPGSPSSTTVRGSWLPRRTNASAIAPSRGEMTDDVTWPTSLPSRKSLVTASTGAAGAQRKPRRVRLTWPRSRAMTIGSWPRKQPFV
jgi:membrane protease YdiL (CAAX protease family)